MDKLRAITFFCRAADTKSFSAAAQALGVVPSVLSKTVAALETALGFRLLNRSTRRLSLTHEGEVYYEQCRALLNGLEEAEANARGGKLRAQGALRIGMHPALRVVVLGALGSFLDLHRKVTVETVMTNSAAAVIDEGLDIVLRIGQPADSGLIARPVGRVRSVACASPAYLSSADELLHPEDLVRHRAIVYGRRDEPQNVEWTFARGAERVNVLVPVRLTLRDGIGVADAAVAGCGVALPLDISVRHLFRSGALQAVLPEWSGEQFCIFAIMPRRTSAPERVRAYLEFFESVLEAGQPHRIGALRVDETART